MEQDTETLRAIQAVEAICRLYDCKIDYQNSDIFHKCLNIIGGTQEQQIDCAEAIDQALNCITYQPSPEMPENRTSGHETR